MTAPNRPLLSRTTCATTICPVSGAMKVASTPKSPITSSPMCRPVSSTKFLTAASSPPTLSKAEVSASASPDPATPACTTTPSHAPSILSVCVKMTASVAATITNTANACLKKNGRKAKTSVGHRPARKSTTTSSPPAPSCPMTALARTTPTRYVRRRC